MAWCLIAMFVVNKNSVQSFEIAASSRGAAAVVIFSLLLLSLVVGVVLALFPAGYLLRFVIPLIAIAVVLFAWAYRSHRNSEAVRVLSVGLISVVALSVLWPRYLFVHKFGLPGVNPLTLMTMFFFGLCVCQLVFSSRVSMRVGGVFRQGAVVSALAVIWLGWRVLASALGEEGLYSSVELLKELVYVGSFFLFGLYLASFPSGPHAVVRTFVFCGFVVALIAIYEALAQHNPFVGFIQITDNSSSAMALASIAADKVRGGEFRVQSTFDHPIVFAQFVAALIPLCFFVVRYDKGVFWRLVGLLAVPLAAVAIIKSGSRSGFVSLAVALTVTGAVWWLRTLVHGRWMKAVAIVVLPALLFGLATAMFVVSELAAGRTRVESGSSNVRLKMLSDGVAALWESPIWGFGHGMALSKAGVVNPSGIATIDSYWLSVAVDYGYIGLLLLVALIVAFSWKGLVFAVRSGGKEGAFVGACVSSVLALFATFAAVSIYQNMTMLWLLIAIAFPIWSGRLLDCGATDNR